MNREHSMQFLERRKRKLIRGPTGWLRAPACGLNFPNARLRELDRSWKRIANSMTKSTNHDSFITIVSGLPRSGTSMMMRMLEAGGMPVLTDEIRKPDLDNPNGYYEFEPVKLLRKDA